MKKHIFYPIIALLVTFVSCTDQLDNKVVFSFTATAKNSSQNGDTLIVNQSEKITFTFKGNAEYITFYNGKAGHEYDKRTLTETPIDDIDSCYLSFTNRPQFGTIPGTLKLYMSTAFSGLSLDNKSADSLLVTKEDWTDLSNDCNFSTTNNVMNNSKVPLKSYADSKITLAFIYKTNDNTTIQPTWQIGNLKIVVKDKKGITTSLAASDLSFNALDMYADSIPYSVSGGAGVWDLTNVASASSMMKIVFTSAGQPLNDDWLISTPQKINLRNPDTGVAVKSIATNDKTYQYSFDTPGVYTIGFQAVNQNYAYRSEIGQTMIIKVK